MNTNAHILIVEDNAANLELMRYLLGAFGYRTRVAESGMKGLDAARLQSPALILCDVQLPDIDGYEVVRRLRSEASLARIPVVAVTALAMVGDRDKVLASGFDGYLSKPLDPQTFVAQVEAFLPENLRRAQTAAAPEAAQARPAPASSGRTILAIDNRPDNLELIASLFEAYGYRIVTTGDAARAALLARQCRPDLIISDVCMPEGSGFELVEAFKADPQLSAIPFVLITSTVATPESRRKGLALGAAKVLFRPIDPVQLLKEIESCLAPGIPD